jgi:phosphate transport system protein
MTDEVYIGMLRDFRSDLAAMGELALASVEQAVRSLLSGDRPLAERVVAQDAVIDEKEIHIDGRGIEILALRQPVAGDLRFITAGMKINSELERIADLAVSIARRVLKDAGDGAVTRPPPEGFPRLGELSREMVRDAARSFAERDAELARGVIAKSREAHGVRDSVQERLMTDSLAGETAAARSIVPHILVTRFFERICDHAVNIAEDVIFLVEAEVVRHHPERLRSLREAPQREEDKQES